jgi:hypothetical protein
MDRRPEQLARPVLVSLFQCTTAFVVCLLSRLIFSFFSFWYSAYFLRGSQQKPGPMPAWACLARSEAGRHFGKALGAPDVLVTREMCEAGANVIEELRDVFSASGLAEAVYIAMARVSIF